jgi:hypothetical protein
MTESGSGPGAPRGDADTIIGALADLARSTSDWLRQEAGSIVREKLVLPLQKVGLTIASASAAGCLLVLGLLFVAAGVLVLLGQWIGYPAALLAIGGVLLLGSLAFFFQKARSMER